jgi:hypothetical protein
MGAVAAQLGHNRVPGDAKSLALILIEIDLKIANQ